MFKTFDNKHIKGVTKSQKTNLIKGDFCQLVKQNMEIEKLGMPKIFKKNQMVNKGPKSNTQSMNLHFLHYCKNRKST